jgi:4,5:9,10-diseco-3-hydroxy-5,9,17-trioxoandrosta-1(10),2-diene-4-oate hydrolase
MFASWSRIRLNSPRKEATPVVERRSTPQMCLLGPMPPRTTGRSGAVPDEESGEASIAAIDAEPGTVPQPNQITAFLEQRLARFKLPKRFVIHDALPREASGKSSNATAQPLPAIGFIARSARALSNRRSEVDLTAKFIDAAGAHTRYYDVGQGEPTILIHGGGPGASGLGNYRKNVEPLAAGRRVIVIDLPGFGETEGKLKDGPIYEVLGDFIRAFMDAIKIEQASFVGNSLGGATALMVALREPNRVNKLVLMGTGGSHAIFSPMPTEGLRRMATFHGGEGPTLEKLKGVIELLVFDPSSITEELMAERLKAATRSDAMDIFKRPRMDIWREDLASLTHKTLLVWGRDDQVIPLDSSFILLKTMPNAQLHVYPKCGHWAQWEKAEEFNELVAAFLDRS